MMPSLWINTRLKRVDMPTGQRGFSLIELMVGLIIGLVATLAISNIFSGYEARKRMISSGSDAQASGVMSMYYIRRDVQNAGFGLPFNSSSDPSPLLCPLNTSVSQSGVVMNLTPVSIVDGGSGSDTITVRYGTSPSGGASLRATGNMTAPTLDGALMGCQVNDVVLFAQTTASPKCTLAKLQALKADRSIQSLNELNTAPTDNPVTDLNGSDRVRFSCLGAWNQYQYTVNSRFELARTGGIEGSGNFPDSTAVPIVSEVVSLQAQYGLANTLDASSTSTTAAAYLNQINQWVDATGTYGGGVSLLNRNRIRAVRVAVVTRDGALQKQVVSQACNGAAAGVSKVCVWNTDGTPASVDLTAVPNWQRYRYRVFEAVIPLRNLIWNRDVL